MDHTLFISYSDEQDAISLPRKLTGNMDVITLRSYREETKHDVLTSIGT
jgi:hypothetical protein